MRAVKNAQVFYQDQTLVRYERAVQDKLRKLMELLEAGDAHLGYDKRVWIPDDTAEVEFTISEGITDPIIVVNVRYQKGKGGAEFRSKQKYYSPYLWVGIKAIDHVVVPIDSPECGNIDFPVSGQLIGFEPLGDQAASFLNSVSTSPHRHDTTTDASNDGHGIVERVALCDWDFPVGLGVEYFGDQSWWMTGAFTSGNAVVARTERGMIATEFCSTKLTLPPQALQPAESGEALGTDYWDRSIIVDPDGHVIFGEDDVNPVTFTHALPEGHSVPVTCDFNAHEVECEVLPGFYEIQAWAESFICACWGAQLHMRMVLGKEARSEEKVFDAETGAMIDFIPGMEPSITVVDIYPEEVGSSNANTRGFLIREQWLGGDNECNDEKTSGSFNPGRGFWQQSLLVDVASGTWRISDARSINPPMTSLECTEYAEWSTECAGFCEPGPFTGASYAPATWDLGMPGGVAATLGQFTFRGPDGNFHTLDFLKLLAFHLARVTAITPDGKICGIQLVGNDGGAGNCADCKPFGYGTVFNTAKGARNLGLGDSYDPSAVAEGGWSVGELVVVTHAGGSPPPFGLAQTGLIVQSANLPIPGTGMDPLSEFAAHTYRCPFGQSVQKAFNGYIDALGVRYSQWGESDPIEARVECVGGRAVFVS